MRISDWSSDVCSSDLVDEVEDSDPCAGPDQDDRVGFVDDVDIDLYMLIDGSEEIFTATTDRIVEFAERMRELAAVHIDQSNGLAITCKGDRRCDTPKSGRPSCRERVCQ